MSKETWMWLAAGLGHGAVNSGELLEAYPGGAEEIEADLGGENLDDILTQKQADRLASSRPVDFALTLARAEAMGVVALPFDDPDYPDMLRSIHNPPPVVFVKGDLTLLNGQLAVGIVGARRPSAYGVEAVKAVGRGVALGGAIIVSGLAEGLDAEAHKAALAVNGPTIACIAFGHDTCYPAANRKLMEVIEHTGAVVSEYPVGTSPEKPFFLQRNRLIAGLSHALVVAEARKYSGTMSTVNFATDYGRDVFAVPGSIFSELSGGTNAMIREGAYVAASATDILSLYGIELPGEDPVAAAARQAVAEERPPAAETAPVWQQSLNRRSTARDRDEDPRPAGRERARDLGQMTMGEALQAAAPPDGGRVSSKQAIEAFRQLQKEMPPQSDSELDARNRALDEMVEAVNDSVEIGAGRMAQPLPEDGPGRVKPFDWSTMARVEKGEGGKKTPRRRGAREADPDIANLAPIEPVGAVRPVPPVMAAERAQMVAPGPDAKIRQPTHGETEPEVRPETTNGGNPEEKPEAKPAGRKKGPSAEPPQVADLPVAEVGQTGAQHPLENDDAGRGRPNRTKADAPGEAPKGGSLAGKLRTLQHAEEVPLPEDLTSHIEFPPTRIVEDARLAGLSENARRAFRQLGPKPVALGKICEGSGLSSGEAMAALTELELVGLSRQLAGRQFVIVQ